MFPILDGLDCFLVDSHACSKAERCPVLLAESYWDLQLQSMYPSNRKASLYCLAKVGTWVLSDLKDSSFPHEVHKQSVKPRRYLEMECPVSQQLSLIGSASMGDAFLWVMLSWLNGDIGAETIQMLSLHTVFSFKFFS